MAGLKFEQDQDNCERQVIRVKTAKRKIGLKLFIPLGQYNHWHIAYEDGRPVKGLSDSVYTSRLFAMKAIELWEELATKSEDAKQHELFGDKQPPVLKRKRVKKNAAAA